MPKEKRSRYGSNNVLDANDVKEIRASYTRRESTQKELAEKYGVSQATISLIVRRRIWTWV